MDKDDFKLNDDTMRDLRALAALPSEFAWRMELLVKLERINQRHELFVRTAVRELKKLEKEKMGLTQVSKRITIELDERLKPARNIGKRIGKGVLWVLERAMILFFAWLGIKLGLIH
jgi:hypothetical protein